jgi:hypothetical protein
MQDDRLARILAFFTHCAFVRKGIDPRAVSRDNQVQIDRAYLSGQIDAVRYFYLSALNERMLREKGG